jgi:hypothetical protein
MRNPRSASGGVLRTAGGSNLDGEYVITNVTPGRYELQAYYYPDNLFALTMVSVDGRDVSASLTLVHGVTLSGRIVFDGTSRAPALSDVLLILRRQLWTIGRGFYRIDADGQFTFTGVPAGAYRLGLNGRPPAGWILRSVTVNGADVADTHFEVGERDNIEGIVVTLTDRPAEISGVLQNADGGPAPDYALVVFSADPRHHVPGTRRTQQVRPDVNGRFVVRDLPAGDYFISTVTDIEVGQWNDPAFLAELAAASPIRIALAEGDRKVQDIRIVAR